MDAVILINQRTEDEELLPEPPIQPHMNPTNETTTQKIMMMIHIIKRKWQPR